jgi:hemolysin activation/secretion protein
MTVGGARFARAFESGHASADRGLAGSIEIARKFGAMTPNAASEAYAFVDGGKLWFTERSGFTLEDIALSSAGGGVRLDVSRDAIVGLEVARQLADREGDGWRMSVTLGSNF